MPINILQKYSNMLSTALLNGHAEIVKLLLQYGAKINPIVWLLIKHNITFNKDDFDMHRFGLELLPGKEEAIVKLLCCK